MFALCCSTIETTGLECLLFSELGPCGCGVEVPNCVPFDNGLSGRKTGSLDITPSLESMTGTEWRNFSSCEQSQTAASPQHAKLYERNDFLDVLEKARDVIDPGSRPHRRRHSAVSSIPGRRGAGRAGERGAEKKRYPRKFTPYNLVLPLFFASHGTFDLSTPLLSPIVLLTGVPTSLPALYLPYPKPPAPAAALATTNAPGSSLRKPDCITTPTAFDARDRCRAHAACSPGQTVGVASLTLFFVKRP